MSEKSGSTKKDNASAENTKPGPSEDKRQENNLTNSAANRLTSQVRNAIRIPEGASKKIREAERESAAALAKKIKPTDWIETDGCGAQCRNGLRTPRAEYE